jgi:hypothetical protein
VGQQGDNRLERSVIERQRGGVRLDERDAEPARSRAMQSWSPDRSTPTTRQPSPVVLGHGLELRVNPFVLRRLWGRVGEEVQQLLGLLRAGLQANADQAHRAARLRATEH